MVGPLKTFIEPSKATDIRPDVLTHYVRNRRAEKASLGKDRNGLKFTAKPFPKSAVEPLLRPQPLT